MTSGSNLSFVVAYKRSWQEKFRPTRPLRRISRVFISPAAHVPQAAPDGCGHRLPLRPKTLRWGFAPADAHIHPTERKKRTKEEKENNRTRCRHINYPDLGWGIFNRNSEEFSSGIDTGDPGPNR